MTTKEHATDALSEAELAAQAGEELPDRAAMSTVSCDPTEFGIVAIEELAPPPDGVEQ